MLDELFRVAILLLQTLHIFVFGLTLFFLYRYHNGEEYSLKAASLVGLVSVPFAMVLLGVLLSKGEPDAILYGICAVFGVVPLGMKIMKKQ